LGSSSKKCTLGIIYETVKCLNSNHRLERNNLSFFLQVDEILRDSPCSRGQFDYVAFSRMLKHGKPSKNA